MNVEEFLSIAQEFACEDESRQSLATSFRHGHHRRKFGWKPRKRKEPVEE